MKIIIPNVMEKMSFNKSKHLVEAFIAGKLDSE